VGMTFERCSLVEADLSLTDLSKASLRNCDLTRADIQEASFSLTDLRGANLTGWNLKRDNLAGIIVTPHQFEVLAGEIGIQVLDS
jgi:fluoroquinolone resistance protein